MRRKFSSRISGVISALFGSLVMLGGSACAADMTFRMVPIGAPSRCGDKGVRVISAEGEITSTTPGDFVRFVRDHIGDPRARSVVFMHSPGGKVVASMELGKVFRKLGAAVVIARVATPEPGSGEQGGFTAARCFSACVYALMGAKKRVVPPRSLVGIHRMFLLEAQRDPDSPGGQSMTRLYADGDIVKNLSRYAGMMGISNDLVKTAESVSPDHIHIVSAQELRRWRLGSTKF